jgi:hypothetical protein
MGATVVVQSVEQLADGRSEIDASEWTVTAFVCKKCDLHTVVICVICTLFLSCHIRTLFESDIMSANWVGSIGPFTGGGYCGGRQGQGQKGGGRRGEESGVLNAMRNAQVLQNLLPNGHFCQTPPKFIAKKHKVRIKCLRKML